MVRLNGFEPVASCEVGRGKDKEKKFFEVIPKISR